MVKAEDHWRRVGRVIGDAQQVDAQREAKAGRRQ